MSEEKALVASNPLGSNEYYKKFEGDQKQLIDAMELDEKGEPKLDKNGKPIFKDSIQMMTNAPEMSAINMCCQELLSQGLVPEPEIEAVFDYMLKVATLHDKNGHKRKFLVTIPINYFVGMWHVVNSCRKFDLFNKDKKLSKAIDGLAEKLARKIDIYHEVKRREGILEEASPDDVLSLPKQHTTNDNYFGEESKPGLAVAPPPSHT